MKDFILPDIGEGIVECEIVEWHVREGDKIEEDQPVCDVMTDKALVEIPSAHSGIVDKLYYKKGDVAKVHSPLFSINTEENIAATDNKTETDTTKKKHPDTNKHRQVSVEQLNKNHPSLAKSEKKVVSSPAVRRLARELHIDLTQVTGSGENGRIYQEDLYAFQRKLTAVAPMQTIQTETSSTVTHTANPTRTESVTGVMTAMAKHMTDAVRTIPHFTFCDEIDLTALVSLRQQLKQTCEQQGIKLTLMPFFIKALSLALTHYPQVNVQTNDNCTKITYFPDHNIGIAVDSKIGLLVPNIKYCQQKSAHEIAAELTKLLSAAREGRVSPENMRGGTITISNIGSIGGTMAVPIINKPEAAIVAMGKIQKLPRFNDTGQIEARQIVCVSWSADHRIIDGATITRLNNQWKFYLENPATILFGYPPFSPG